MVNLLQINGTADYRVFAGQAGGSELRLAELNLHTRKQIINLAVRDNFGQVIFINPELNQALNALISDLAEAMVISFVISNQGLLKRADNYKDIQKEDAITYLTGYLLPNNAICRPPSYSLSALVPELRNKTSFKPGRNLVIANFSLTAVIAGLELFGFHYDQSCFKFNTPPLQNLKTLLDELENYKYSKTINLDRREEFLPILRELAIN